MIEIWKDIPSYEGYYQVSNLGNFRSLDRIIKGNKGYRKYPGKSLLTERTKDNYERIVLMKEGHKIRYMAHRLVAITFIPNIENKPCINHIDGIKYHNYIDNLEWCTISENSKHAMKTGLWHPELNIPSNSKAVKCIEDNIDFKTIHKAAAYYNVNITSISRAIRQNRSCKGKHYVYI